jgi:elongation factor 1 alpha-like protein
VRELLLQGSSHITDKQIQEALWHYYYDVDKSIAYLRREYMAKPKKEQKKLTGGSRLYFHPYMHGR